MVNACVQKMARELRGRNFKKIEVMPRARLNQCPWNGKMRIPEPIDHPLQSLVTITSSQS